MNVWHSLRLISISILPVVSKLTMKAELEKVSDWR